MPTTKNIERGVNYLGNKKFSIYVEPCKWYDIINDTSLMFLKGSNVYNNIIKSSHVIMRIGSWDDRKMLDTYRKVKKIRNKNIIKYLCYFEYEEDIINILSKSSINEDYNELSVIIYKNYDIFANNLLLLNCDNNLYDCYMQIILTIYDLFYTYNLYYKNLNVNDLFIDKIKTKKKLNYELLSYNYYVFTDIVLKMDGDLLDRTDDVCETNILILLKELLTEITNLFPLYSVDNTLFIINDMILVSDNYINDKKDKNNYNIHLILEQLYQDKHFM